MDNLARVIAVTMGHNNTSITPCVKVLRGADAAARSQAASFTVNFSVTFTSGGQHLGPIVSSQDIARFTPVQQLDAYFTRSRGLSIDLPAAPDPHTPIVVTASLQYPDALGVPFDVGPSDSNSFTPTLSLAGVSTHSAGGGGGGGDDDHDHGHD